MISSKLQSVDRCKKGIFLFFLCTFFSNFIIAADIYGVPVATLSNIIIILCILSYIIINRCIIYNSFNKIEKIFCILYFIPIIISLFASSINTLFLYRYGYSTEYVLKAIPRLFNCVILFLYLCIYSVLSKKNQAYNIHIFYYSLLIFLTFGLWQLLHFYLDVPFIDIVVRDAGHSLKDTYMIKRVTSIAREPSFLSPLMVELFIIILYFKETRNTNKTFHYFILSLILLVIIFMLSPSVYIEFIVLFMIAIFRKRMTLSKLFISIIAILILYYSLGDDINRFFVYRLVNVGESSRFLEIKTVLDFMLFQNYFTLFFGLGPKGFNFLCDIISIEDSNQQLMITTNNILMDTFVEEGILGFICILLLFYYLIKECNLIKNSNIPLYFGVHIFLFNQYRGEYASLRFIVVFCILVFFIEFYKSKQLLIHNTSYY